MGMKGDIEPTTTTINTGIQGHPKILEWTVTRWSQAVGMLDADVVMVSRLDKQLGSPGIKALQTKPVSTPERLKAKTFFE